MNQSNPAPLHGIVFDLDGTLADTLPICYRVFRHTFERYGDKTYTDEEIHALFGLSAVAFPPDQLDPRGHLAPR